LPAESGELAGWILPIDASGLNKVVVVMVTPGERSDITHKEDFDAGFRSCHPEFY